MSLSWFFRKPLHPVAEAYLEGKRASKPSRRSEVDGLRFIVLDAETTGFDPDRDRILSLATAEVKNWKMPMSELRSWMLFQPRTGINQAVAIHGITPSETATGEPEEKVLDELLGVLRGAILVGHHISFDAAMISNALRRHFGIGLYNPIIDTASLAMHELEAFRKTGYANQRPPSLEELCANCGVPMMERHTADGDVFTTAELFMILCARRRKRLGRPLEWRDMPWSKI